MKKTDKIFLQVVMMIALATGSILSVNAQLPYPEGPTKDRASDDTERDLEERIAYQRFRAQMAMNPPKKRDPKLALAELVEDFKQIQVVNLEMVRALSKGGTLDLKFVGNTTAEIKKRAVRLKENLALPKPEKEETRPPQNPSMTLEQLKWSMLSLGKLIYGFVKSPFFREIDVVNQQEGLKVLRDLEGIIELSDSIKKNSESLKKNARQSQ